MADKKKDNQLVIPPIGLVNRFQVLGTIPRPNYQSALARPVGSQYIVNDPFAAAPIQQIVPTPSHSSKSDHIAKPNSVHLFFIEPHRSHIRDPITLVNATFPRGWHFHPKNADKSLSYYKDILFHTEFIKIKPINDRNDPSKILYHSIYIFKIISSKEWGSHPCNLKSLSKYSVQYKDRKSVV